MTLQEELLELAEKVNSNKKKEIDNSLLLHAKAHMFHNKKMHSQAIELMQKHNINHEKFDDMDI